MKFKETIKKVNFKTAIERVANKPNVPRWHEDHLILAVPAGSERDGSPVYRFYAMERSKQGDGTFGEIHKAFLIDKETGELDKKVTWAVNIIPNFSAKSDALFKDQIFRLYERAEAPAKIFRHYYRAEAPLIIDDKGAYFITEYFPGEDVLSQTEDGYELNESFKNLDLGQTLELINQVCMTLNLLHHKTPATGDAVILGNLSGENIKVDINAKGREINGSINSYGRVNVYLSDLGAGKYTADNPNVMIDHCDASMDEYHAAPEVIIGNKKMGLKSNLFSIGPMIIALLGGKPYKSKAAMKHQPSSGRDVNRVMSLVNYNFDEMFKKFEKDLDEKLRDPNQIQLAVIKDPVHAFIKRMVSSYNKRPDSDETLKFFTALNNSYKIYKVMQVCNPVEVKSHYESYLKNVATLMLCAKGLWQNNYYQMLLSNYPGFSKGIIKLYQEGSLNADSLKSLEKSWEHRDEYRDKLLTYLASVLKRLREDAQKNPDRASHPKRFQLELIEQWIKREGRRANTVIGFNTYNSDIIKKLLKKEEYNVNDLKFFTSLIRSVTKVNRDTGSGLTGVLTGLVKFNFLRNTTSYDALKKIVDKDNNLRPNVR